MAVLLCSIYLLFCCFSLGYLDNSTYPNTNRTCFYFPTNYSVNVSMAFEIKIALVDFINIAIGNDSLPFFANTTTDTTVTYHTRPNVTYQEAFTIFEEDDERAIIKHMQSLGALMFGFVVARYPEVLGMDRDGDKVVELHHNALCVNYTKPAWLTLNQTILVSWFQSAVDDLSYWHIECFGPFLDSLFALMFSVFMRRRR